MIIKEKIRKINYAKDNFYIFTLQSKTRVKYEGELPFEISNDMYLKMNGEFYDDVKYGRTFVATNIEELKETKKIKLLELAIDGIGEKIQTQILEDFDSLDIFKENPFKIFDYFLSETSKSILQQIQGKRHQFITHDKETDAKLIAKEIKGLGKKKILSWMEDFESWHKYDVQAFLEDINIIKYLASPKALNVFYQIQKIEELENDYNTFLSFGLSEFSIGLIFKQYKYFSMKKITENPYLLLDFYVQFPVVDKIAIEKFEVDKENYERIIQGIKYIIKTHEEEGSTFVYFDDCVNESYQFLDVEKELVEAFLTNELAKEIEDREFILEKNKIYRRVIFFTERKLGKMIYEKTRFSKNDVPEEVNTYLKNTTLSEEQVQAVCMLLKEKIAILTGGPGTGKTTTINELCNCLEKMNRTYVLCAPTGRAAKRITESTKRNASTIHRLLEYKKQGLSGYFQKNERYPINADTIIVDESSMIDVYILNSLIKACKETSNIIFVGDVDQLPSVSMGSVLADMKESGKVPVFTLTKIFRQEGVSTIVKNAYHVKNNEAIEEGEDFKFIKINNFKDINKYLTENTISQILCPMKVGNIGTIRINQTVQNIVNKNEEKIYYNGTVFKTGDKVIQMSNDYDKEVYNGEIGYIKSIKNDEIKVVFPMNDVEEINYKYSELYKLDLAYAVTIHKSQGSETDDLIIIVDGNEDFISKELIYTAITRAKKNIVLLSTYDKEFFTNLKNSNKRLTNLKEKIR